MKMAFNTSNGTTPNVTVTEEESSAIMEPPELRTFRRILFSFVMLFALFGNAIVIRAIRCGGRSRKPFTHYLVTNLAVAELLNSFFFIFIFCQEESWRWMFGSFMCHVVMPGGIVTFSVTTATLACISLYRYRVLVTPYKKYPSKKACLIVIVVIWLYSFAFAMPITLTTKNDYYGKDYICFSTPLHTYSLVRAICQFFIPVIMMFIGYSVASVKIKEHMTFMETRRQSRLNSNISSLNTYLESQANESAGDNNFLQVPHQHPLQPAVPLQSLSPRGSVCHGGSAPESSSCSGREDGHMIETERDIIKMFYVVVLVFLVCYIPYQVFFMLDHFSVITPQKYRYYHILRDYALLLHSLPSALHPLCYGTMSTFYARAFAKIVLCKCRKY